MTENRLLTDPDCELGIGHLSTNGGPVLTHRVDGADHGTGYVRATWPASGAAYVETERLISFPGQVWSFNPSIKIGSGAPPGELLVAYYDASGALITTRQSTAAPGPAWSRPSKQDTLGAPAGTAYVAGRIRRPAAGAAAGQATDFDALVLAPEAYIGPYIAPVVLTGKHVITLVLDDAAWRDMKRVAQFQTMRTEGITAPGYAEADPSCSPSRASFLTGLSAVNHGVPNVDNSTQVWRNANLDEISLGTLVAAAGGRSHCLGKFLHDAPMDGSWTPAGWSTVLMTNEGYRGWQVPWVKRVGTTVTTGTTGLAEGDFHVDWLRDESVALIADHGTNHADKSMFMVINVQANHGNHGEDPISGPTKPAVAVAPRHRPRPTDPADIAQWAALGWTLPPEGANLWEDVTVFDDPTALWNNVPPEPIPGWFKGSAVGPVGLAQAVLDLRDRVRALQSVGELYDAVMAALIDAGMAADTTIVLISDNGLHMVEHTLRGPDKGTFFPYDTDVPAIIRPAGGITGTDVNDLIGTTSWAPTILELLGIDVPDHIDGRSLVDLINLVGGRTKANRALTTFRDLDKDWDDRLGTDKAPSWDRLKFIDAAGDVWLYASHEPDAITPPPDPKGILFNLTDDQYCMVNLYDRLTDASKLQLQAALTETRDAQGLTARAVVLTVGPTPQFAGDDPQAPERQYFIQDVELPYYIRVSDGTVPWPARIAPEPVMMAGNHGPISNGGTDMFGPATFTWEFLVDDDLVDPFAEHVREGMDWLARIVNVGSTGDFSDRLVHVRIRFRDGQEREARVKVLAAVPYVRRGRYLYRIVVTFRNDDPFWRLPFRITDPVLFGWGSEDTSGILKFDLFASHGPTAAMQDGRLTLRGLSIPGPIEIIDSASQGTGFRYLGDISGTERVTFDFLTWTATKYANDEDTTGVDQSGPEFLQRVIGTGRWLILEPSKLNARYAIEIKTGGPVSSDATAELFGAPRWVSAHA